VGFVPKWQMEKSVKKYNLFLLSFLLNTIYFCNNYRYKLNGFGLGEGG
jgi:hypothetical protein